MEVCKQCNRQYVTENDFLSQTSRWRICSEGHLWFNCSCGSLITVKKGKFPWFSPEKVMAPDKASLFNLLSKKSSMPYIPTSIMELQIAIADEGMSAADLGKIAKKDPLLSADILSHANNLKLADGQKITSLVHAFTFIGRKTIGELVLVSAVKAFKFKTQKFSSQDFWKKSKITGIIAEHLCRQFAPQLESEQAYLAGALCNIGKVVAAISLPDVLDQVYELTYAPDAELTWNDVEKKLSAPSHCTMGEIACTIWGLPSYISEASSLHHSLADTQKTEWSFGELSSFANQLCHVMLGEVSQMEDSIMQSYSQKSQLNDAKTMKMLDEIKNLLPTDLLST